MAGVRKFGTDAPKFMEFALVGDEKTVYKLPVATSLPLTTIIELQEAEEAGGTRALRTQLDLLRRYMGDVVDGLSSIVVREIYDAWNDVSAEAGASPGE